jgi:hypothetical protein
LAISSYVPVVVVEIDCDNDSIDRIVALPGDHVGGRVHAGAPRVRSRRFAAEGTFWPGDDFVAAPRDPDTMPDRPARRP